MAILDDLLGALKSGKIDPEMQQGLLAAGLGILSQSNQQTGEGPLAGIGRGGLLGLQAYSQGAKGRAKSENDKALREEKRLAIEDAKLLRAEKLRKEQDKSAALEQFLADKTPEQQALARVDLPTLLKTLTPQDPDSYERALQQFNSLPDDDPDKQRWAARLQGLEQGNRMVFENYANPIPAYNEASGKTELTQFGRHGDIRPIPGYSPAPAETPTQFTTAIAENNEFIAAIDASLKNVEKGPGAFGLSNYAPNKLVNLAEEQFYPKELKANINARSSVAEIANKKINIVTGATIEKHTVERLGPVVPDNMESRAVITAKLKSLRERAVTANESILELERARKKPGGLAENVRSSGAAIENGALVTDTLEQQQQIEESLMEKLRKDEAKRVRMERIAVLEAELRSRGE